MLKVRKHKFVAHSTRSNAIKDVANFIAIHPVKIKLEIMIGKREIEEERVIKI